MCIDEPTGDHRRARITQIFEIGPQTAARRIADAHPLHNLPVPNTAAAQIALGVEVGAQLMPIKIAGIAPQPFSVHIILPDEGCQCGLEAQPMQQFREPDHIATLPASVAVEHVLAAINIE